MQHSIVPLALCALLAWPGSATQAQDAQDAVLQGQAPEATEELVLSIEILGVDPAREADLRAALDARVGQALDLDRLDRSIERIWLDFHARLEVGRRQEPAGIRLRVQVFEEHADLEPRFVGNSAISDEKLLEWAGLSAGQELYPGQAPRVRQRLLEGYRRDGFYFVEVKLLSLADEDPQRASSAPDLIFEILEGPRVKVRELVIEGNTALPDRGFWLWKAGLRAEADVRLDTPAVWFTRKRLVQEELDADLVALRQVYRDHGYFDAVVELERLEFNQAHDLVTIHLSVDQGAVWTVGSRAIEGAVPDGRYDDFGEPLYGSAALLFDQETLLALCELEVGQPYERATVDQDDYKLRDYYGQQGYVAHPSLAAGERWRFLEPQLVFDVEKHQVHVTYRLAQGSQIFLREVRFDGTEHTQDRVVRRLVTAYPGQLANLKQIQSSLSRLRSTGWFSDPWKPLEHPEPSFAFRDTQDPAWKDLEFVLSEGQVLNFDISAGYGDSTGLFGVLGVSKKNFDLTDTPDSGLGLFEEIAEKRAFHGAGQELRLTLSPGTNLSTYQVHFTEPDLFRSHVERISLDLDFERRLRFLREYDEQRDEASFSLGRQIGDDGALFGGFTLGSAEVDNIDQGGEPSVAQPLAVPKLLKEQEGDSELSYLSVGYRYRTLDSAFNPHTGKNLRVVANIYNQALVSDYDFWKLTFTSEYYGLFGIDKGKPRKGWKLSFDLGLADTYAATQDVPYTERFFLGGSKTLRGFSVRGVGPNQFNIPLGGETMVAASAEYRMPLFSMSPAGSAEEVEVLRGLLFLDTGVLDPDPYALDLGELRSAWGFGLGLSYPFPINISFGFPLQQGQGDDQRVFALTIGGF